jgi:hypothetical protein
LAGQKEQKRKEKEKKKRDTTTTNPSDDDPLNHHTIENLWFILKDRVRRHRPKSLDELKYYIQLEWDKITEEDIKKLVKTMQKRIRAVIANNGGHCKY